jgi:hypothetical protein
LEEGLTVKFGALLPSELPQERPFDTRSLLFLMLDIFKLTHYQIFGLSLIAQYRFALRKIVVTA